MGNNSGPRLDTKGGRRKMRMRNNPNPPKTEEAKKNWEKYNTRGK